MTTHGPIDFIVLSFSGNKFKGEIMDNLTELVENHIIRVIDLLIVLKDEQGDIIAVELEQHNPEISEFFKPLDFETNGMITTADVEMIGAELENNSACETSRRNTHCRRNRHRRHLHKLRQLVMT